MIFVWATCLAGIAKSPPWPPDLAIRRERLAETTTNAIFSNRSGDLIRATNNLEVKDGAFVQVSQP
jgi:hypothetical protein